MDAIKDGLVLMVDEDANPAKLRTRAFMVLLNVEYVCVPRRPIEFKNALLNGLQVIVLFVPVVFTQDITDQAPDELEQLLHIWRREKLDVNFFLLYSDNRLVHRA